MLRRIFCLLPLLLALAGCELSLPDRVVPPDVLAFAKESVSLIVARDVDGVIGRLDPALQDQQPRQNIERLYRVVPAEAPTAIKIIGANFQGTSNGPSSYFLTLQCDFPNTRTIVWLAMRHDESRYVLTTLRARSAAELSAETSFSLDGKGLGPMLFLLACVAAMVFVVVTVIACIRTTGMRRKWLWILFILFGFGQITLNWSTGVFNLTPLGIQMLSAGFSKMYYQPLLLQLGIPIGAILFWRRRRRQIGDAGRLPSGGPLETPIVVEPRNDGDGSAP